MNRQETIYQPAQSILHDSHRRADHELAHCEQDVLDAIAEDLFGGDGVSSAERALCAYVDHLKVNGALPETMIVQLKQLLRRSVLGGLQRSDDAAIRAAIISRSIVAYFGVPARAD
jgi:hypothetical protein